VTGMYVFRTQLNSSYSWATNVLAERKAGEFEEKWAALTASPERFTLALLRTIFPSRRRRHANALSL
jgi:hypothetical protein